MNTASTNSALAHERCQHRTPTGRQCASHILDPESSYCPVHTAYQPFASQPSESQDFAALLTENACDFQDPQGINHSLAALYKLLASGRISPRRAPGLAYIASLLLRTLPAINNQLNGNESAQFEIVVPPRDHFPPTADEEPNGGPNEDDPQGRAPHNHAPQQPASQACL